MKILAVTHHPDRAETELFALLHKDGVALEVMCHKDAKWLPVLKEADVPVTLFDGRGRFNKKAEAQIRARLEATKAQILYMLNSHAVSNGMRAAKGLPVRTVGYRGVVGGLSWLDPAAWLTYFHPRLDRVVCVAEAIRQWFIGHRLFGVYPKQERFVTIHKGHRTDWYQPAPRKALYAFGIPSDAFVVCLVANYRKGKGVEVLIDAAAELPKDIHILLIGKMDDPDLLGAINQSPAKERIHLTGFREDSAALAGACDLYVLCSFKKEGLPKTVIEAMSQGVPAIVANAGGSPELVRHCENGYIVQPNEPRSLAHSIIVAKSDKPRLEAMGVSAQNLIREKFYPERTMQLTRDLFVGLTSTEK
ncbi:MAG: glycosyltransferase family 4 protein [Campylobacterales bacterium]